MTRKSRAVHCVWAEQKPCAIIGAESVRDLDDADGDGDALGKEAEQDDVDASDDAEDDSPGIHHRRLHVGVVVVGARSLDQRRDVLPGRVRDLRLEQIQRTRPAPQADRSAHHSIAAMRGAGDGGRRGGREGLRSGGRPSGEGCTGPTRRECTPRVRRGAR
eukprot:1095703-Rhodomonas_salina.1